MKNAVQKARLSAVAEQHMNLSTAEIQSRIDHASTLVSMYDAQRVRAQRSIAEAQADIKTADKMIETLSADVDVMHQLVRLRQTLVTG
jgi:hypothetical protein